LDGNFRLGLADAEPPDGLDEEPPPSEFSGKVFWFKMFEWRVEACFFAGFLYGTLATFASACRTPVSTAIPSVV
jgi:hypothetical protein